MMNRILLLTILMTGITFAAFSQNATIRGIITDAQTKETLAGASVSVSPQNAVLTDATGHYEIKVPAGTAKVTFSFVGLQKQTEQIIVKAGEEKTINISLKTSDQEMGTVTVTVGKITKRIQKESISIEVMKPRLLQTNNITNVQDAINKVPGVTIMDNSISIRGGSGYAYGSGSRVMMVIDDMPLITPDRGEIKWQFVPLENVSQLEILKGASSVQYGSGALNGVISLRTADPTDTPATKITLYTEILGNPKVKGYKWWGKENNVSYLEGPHTIGMSFVHSRKIGKDVQLTLGGNFHDFQSHLKDEIEQRIRINGKLKYTPHKIKNLTLGLSFNVMLRKSSFQFYWQDIAHPYLGAPGVTIQENYLYTIVDPSISYTDRSNSQHRLMMRWYRQKSTSTDARPRFDMFYADYQFRHDFGKIAKVLVGLNNNHFNMQDNTLGVHNGDQGGGYVQGEIGYKGLTVNVGARFEFIHLDSAVRASKPVFLAGLNYQFRKYNYIRASFGQSYRYGSPAERFVLYDLGNIHILPNQTLQPESGFTAEVGYKRMFAIAKNFRGFVDAAMFMTQFKNMIEFQLQYATINADGSYAAYFRSANVTKARIFGWEFNLVGEGRIGPVDFTVQGGYTYFYPRDMSDTTRSNNLGTFFKDAFNTYYKPNEAQQAVMLKYRNRHTFKFDVDALLYKHVRIGSSVNYYSYMDGIDVVFTVAVSGLTQYRTEHYNKGDWVWDMRLGYDFTKNLSFNFLVKNILNNDYAIRIAKPNPPRSFSLQLMAKF